MNRLQANQIGLGFLAVVIAFPHVPGGQDVLRSATEAAIFTIIAASLVMLTGWVGQISLGHAALVGVGAYATGFAVGKLGLGFPLSLPVSLAVAAGTAALLGVVALRVRGLYLAVATLIFSWAASEFLFRQQWVLEYGSIPRQTIGSEGTWLYLDLGSTMTFYYVAWATAIAVLFALMNLRDSKTGRAFFAVRGSEMAAASLGMDILRYKSLAFALSGALAGLAGNLMMTNAGVVSADTFDFNRSLFFLAIAVVGGLASLPGAVVAAILFAGMSELFFQVEFLNAYLQLVSAVLLAVVFRVYPGGLAAFGHTLLELVQRARALPGQAAASLAERRQAAAAGESTESAAAERPTEELPAAKPTGRAGRLADSLAGRATGLARRPMDAVMGRLAAMAQRRKQVTGEEPLQFHTAMAQPAEVAGGTVPGPNGQHAHAAEQDAPAPTLQTIAGPAEADRRDPATRHERRALIEAEHITVRFGGLTAVNDASLAVREGEIVGLIGPNGAGKTTLFNSIAGFNVPTEGRVKVYGQDVTDLPVAKRAQLGLARTFQLIQLFPQLTVFDNLLAATHLQNPTGFVQHMAVTPEAIAAEAAARDRVEQVINLLDLAEVADQRVSGIPFGTLRMIEVARSLVTGARVIMLDEPASGLDERETDRLTEVLRFVRGLGATLLLIEHDVRMVTSVSDYLYVIDRGNIIAEGGPVDIQRNPDVIAAYLGASADDHEVQEAFEDEKETVA
jgi:branched-chain amino acid transport system ATP-binding protein